MLTVLPLSLLCSLIPIVVAQSQPHAQCTNVTTQWTFNSLGQSPCQVAEYLGGVCNNGVYTIPPLGPTDVYTGPTLSNANACRCSTAFYSMLSACAFCQSRPFPRWSSFSSNCSTDNGIGFPDDIPLGTTVPAFAFQDVTVGDTFNITLAQSLLGSESMGLPKPSGTSPLPSPPASATATSPVGSSSRNIGPIVGGVVGAVAGIALLAALGCWWTRRRRSKVRVYPSPSPTQADLMGGGYEPRPISYATSTSTVPMIASPVTVSTGIYDPGDRSTMFTSPISTSSTYQTLDQQRLSRSGTGSTAPLTTHHNFTGAPEL